MNHKSAASIATLFTATLAFGTARSQGVTFQVADSKLSSSVAAFMTDARNVLSAYVAACGAHDVPGIARTTTGDAEIEFATDEPGQYLAVDLNGTGACWTNAPADVWIYPTPAADTVFVNLVEVTSLVDAHTPRHLALVKISAGRISQIRDFPTPPWQTTLTVDGNVRSGTCAVFPFRRK